VWTFERDNADDLAGPIAFDRDGTLVALSHSRYVTRLVDPDTGRILASLENPDGIATSHLAFDGDAELLAVVSPTRDLFAWDLKLIRARLSELDLDFDWGPD
jgi:hypothetical protein